ncbi:hypothetical protein DY000_02015055 [Brassica cretica]|uniref:Uncharacterized protein n=1 Tax=Brassica cretica TaxID=69181 RepID=A0ABQ7CYN7_BRACR|nr:hypothetical protein DY000_02015055 [Brassica cretica]
MEDMEFGRISINEMTTTLSDRSIAESIDAAHQTSMDDTPPEAGKFPLTNDANKGVVLGEPKGQLSNAINQIINKQETEIPVKIKPISERDHETKLPLQDYLNPGRTYSNRSAIKLPKDDTKKSGVSLEYFSWYVKTLSMEPSQSTHTIEHLEDMMDDEYNRSKIKESLDSLHSALEGQKQFGIYQIDNDTLSELEQRVDFIDNSTLKDRYPIPNPDSFTQNYDATVGSRRGSAKFRLNQAFTENRKMATDLNGKIDVIYTELMRNFDSLSEHTKRLDGQIAKNAIAIKREAGCLPVRTDANPKRQINDVLLRSGRSFNPSTIEINQAEKHVDVERPGENRSRPIILDNPNPESETPRESERSNTEDASIDLEEEEEELEEELEIDRQEGTNVDRPTAENIDRQTESNIDRRSTPAEPAVERVYKTLPPFPPKKMQTKRELDKAICKKTFDKITLEMPLSDAIKVSSSIKKYVKDMVSNSFPEETFSVDIRAEECT